MSIKSPAQPTSKPASKTGATSFGRSAARVLVANNVKEALGAYCLLEFETQILQAEHLALGSGTTVFALIEQLSVDIKAQIYSASAKSHALLAQRGIHCHPIGSKPSHIDLYIDGADTADHSFNLLKGRGLAMTYEKALAKVSTHFICVASADKYVASLQASNPHPHGGIMLEVEQNKLPAFEQALLKQFPASHFQLWSSEHQTDQGNRVVELAIEAKSYDAELEHALAQLPGVVDSGLFAINRPTTLLLGQAITNENNDLASQQPASFELWSQAPAS